MLVVVTTEYVIYSIYFGKGVTWIIVLAVSDIIAVKVEPL